MYCRNCGTQLADDSSFCQKCGASVTLGRIDRTGFELLRDEREIQNHWAKRVIAFIIDAVVVSVAFSLIVFISIAPFFAGNLFVQPLPFWWGFVGFGFGLSPLILVAYFIIAESLYATTIGKHLMGLKVIRLDGQPLSFSNAVIRNISKIFWVLLLLDLALGLGMHGDPRQKYGDRHIGTAVEAVTKLTIIP